MYSFSWFFFILSSFDSTYKYVRWYRTMYAQSVWFPWNYTIQMNIISVFPMEFHYFQLIVALCNETSSLAKKEDIKLYENAFNELYIER